LVRRRVGVEKRRKQPLPIVMEEMSGEISGTEAAETELNCSVGACDRP
jgi:hypothetical protein